MPSGRRNLSRSGLSRPPQPLYSSCDDVGKSRSLDGGVISPKHIPVPSLPHDTGMLFEVMMLVYTVMAAVLQFLHLYRSVWWLSHSYTRYSINFYLIDPYLVGFIGTILARRLAYYGLCKVLLMWTPPTMWPLIQQILRVILLAIVLTAVTWCIYNIVQSHPSVNILYLCYPVSMYLILFGFSIGPFFDVMSHPVIVDETKGRIIGKPLHSCSTSPQTIREEVDQLKTDFNNRMKHILFSSVLNAYYATFVPCCFAQSYLYYDVYWATQHLTFVWLGCFTMYIVHCYPIKYYDTLHQAALHLGKWSKIEGRSCHLPSHLWAESTLWHQGALVKHCKELYKAEGMSNAAEPGNSTHTRFYALFNNPSSLLCLLGGFQLSLVILQVVILVRVSEWYQMMSITLLLVANYYTLFKFSRDYLICFRVYKAEEMLQDKAGGG